LLRVGRDIVKLHFGEVKKIIKNQYIYNDNKSIIVKYKNINSNGTMDLFNFARN